MLEASILFPWRRRILYIRPAFNSLIPRRGGAPDFSFMASSKAHHATGWAAGFIAAAAVEHAGMGGPWHVWSCLALFGGGVGGSAPDWLEVAWWRRSPRLWLTHRTLTHWGLAWLALLGWSYLELARHWWAAPLFGFAAGGVMHLLTDWPNPMGVPWLFSRHSLCLWKSGNCEPIIIGVAWSAALLVGDHVFFAGVHALKALAYVKALVIWS